jgi:hypothetical protein
VNSALAMIEAAEPKDKIEGALALQMAATHASARSVLSRFEGGGGSERRVVALGSAAARLLRAYAAQVEALRRIRRGGTNLSGSNTSMFTTAVRLSSELCLSGDHAWCPYLFVPKTANSVSASGRPPLSPSRSDSEAAT